MADPGYIVDGVLTDGEAWIALQSTTVTGATTHRVTFASTDDGQVGDWSQYMDLVLISYAQSGATGSYPTLVINNDDTGANYPRQQMLGDGSSVSAFGSTSSGIFFMFDCPMDGTDGDAFGGSILHFFDINSGKSKGTIGLSGTDADGSGHVAFMSTIFDSQAPIIEMDIDAHDVTASVYWTVGSRFDLFGILPRMVA